SSHLACAAPYRNPAHPYPRPSSSRPPPRRITMKKRTLLSALAVTSVLALSACGGGGGNPLSGGGDNSGSSGSQVIVGSADFTESQLIPSLYSQALQANGFGGKEQVNNRRRQGYTPGLKDRRIRS